MTLRLFTDTTGLYALNETTSQVTLLASIATDVDGVGSEAGSLAATGGHVYFAGGNASSPVDLYVSDGTAAGTKLVKSFAQNGNGTATIADFTPLSNGDALFVYDDGNGNQTLWTTNGTKPPRSRSPAGRRTTTTPVRPSPQSISAPASPAKFPASATAR